MKLIKLRKILKTKCVRAENLNAYTNFLEYTKQCQPVQRKSLRYTIWLYFMVFICITITMLWTFQFIFLPYTYQKMKTRDFERVASSILNISTDDDLYYTLRKLAKENNMSIAIMSTNGISLLFEDTMAGNGVLSHDNQNTILQYSELILKSDTGVIFLPVSNGNFKTLLFGMLIGTKEDPQGYIFLNTSIEMLDSTTNILQQQLIYLTFALLALTLTISFFMARKIARPIVKITKSAKDLAQGNYNINFDGKGYDESEKLAETLNYASNEISKVDSLRRDLIANISHDLRTPLTMVKAYAEMVRDLSGDNPVKRNEHINVIIEESDRLASLVNDILDISRIESGNQELNRSDFKITQKLSEILDRYKLLSEQQGYVFTFDHDEEIIVNADIIKIEQVIYNLINNAVNYTGADKHIIIRQINSPKSVRIEVSDTGPGIPQDKLPLIFDRYYRAEKNKREVIGTGLGLSIVKAVLKQHNFPFGVHSQEGKGSTFWFEIIR